MASAPVVPPPRAKTSLPSARASLRPLAKGDLFSLEEEQSRLAVTSLPAARPQASLSPGSGCEDASLRPAVHTVPPGTSSRPAVPTEIPKRNALSPRVPLREVPGARPRVPTGGWAMQAQRAAVVAVVAAVLGGGVWLYQHQARGPVVGMPVLKSVMDGNHVRWATPTFRMVVDASLSQIDPDAVGTVSLAMRTWSDCGQSVPVGQAEGGEGLAPGYQPQGSNENAVLYKPEGWGPAGGALAITVLTFDNETGHIVDADIIINGGPHHPFAVLEAGSLAADGTEASLESQGSTATSTAPFDLPSLLAHEMGHVLGMGEDFDNHHATMFVTLWSNDVSKRVLAMSDMTGVLTLYHQDPPSNSGCGSSSQPQLQQKGADAPAVLLAPAVLTLASARRRARALVVGLAVVATAALAVAQVKAPQAAPPAFAAASDDTAATARVLDAVVARSGGMLATELRVVIESCAPWQRGCVVAAEVRFTVAGGTEGHLTQQVGLGPVPAAGERVPLVTGADGQLTPAHLIKLTSAL